MPSVNKVILIGNLGQDPELRFTQGGTPVANFSIATNESWTSREGNREERTEWHHIVVWGKTAELCKEFLSKGRTVYIEGRLQTRDWTDKDGHNRRSTEIVAQQVIFLGGRAEGGHDMPEAPMHIENLPNNSEEDIPF
ncbi:MAG: single-stranded DNA-binding protein [Deltaproteobacteria bacterium]|nr:single-stranded DNA-binding protein [Deltaproteobacteria bacterium]